MKLTDINYRDPFVLPVASEKAYYLFGTDGSTCWDKRPQSVNCYRSTDLENWSEPIHAFSPDENFWSQEQYWAPEVHAYRDAYYMFITLHSANRRRGTQILRADNVGGPYLPISDGPVTPADWECLDGTLWVDNGKPYIVFCHEWVQIDNGTICAMPLSDDLSHAVGDAVVLFAASDAPWVDAWDGQHYVTDGPFLFELPDGKLGMLWSSFQGGQYAQGVAISETGILGPWMQQQHTLANDDAGHGMVFHSFEGQWYLSLHKPNNTPHERPVFRRLNVTNDGLEVE